MEVINRKSKQVVINGGRSVTRMYVSVEFNKIYFTSTVSRLCELGKGLYVHFLNDGGDWQFFINDDEDGFKLTPVKQKNGYHVTNVGLVNMILKSTGHKAPKKFHIEKTNTIHDKCPVFSLTP